MVSGINGAGGSRYLAQISQAGMNLWGSGGSSLINTTKAQVASKTRSVSLDQVFGKIDTNGDEKISKQEFRNAKSDTEGKVSEALSSLKTGSTASLVTLLQSTNEASTGGSQTTTKSSTAASDQLFGKIDTNSDGVITKDELDSLRSSLQSGSSTESTDAGTGGTSSTASSAKGTTAKSSATNPLSAEQNLAMSLASQKRAVMQQAVSQYKQLAQAGQIAGSMAQYLFTG